MYRTLDVLEELGYLHHSHGADGREEFHVLPHDRARPPALRPLRRLVGDPDGRGAGLVDGLQRSRGFRVHVGHLTITGVCAACSPPRDDV